MLEGARMTPENRFTYKIYIYIDLIYSESAEYFFFP